MLSSQSPDAANTAKAASAQIAARTPPKRSDTRTPATVTPTHVIHPRKLVNQVTRLSRKSAKPLNARITMLGLSALRWSTSHVWKSFRYVGSEFQVERRGPRVLRPKREVADQHHADDGSRQRHPAPPPGSVLDEERRGRAGRRSVGDDRHGSAALARDRLQRGDAVDHAQHRPVLHRSNGALARGDHRDGLA